MTQTYDVVLNSAGYMLVPPPDRPNATLGSYKLTVTPFKPSAVRTGIREWTLPPDGKDASRWRSDSLVNELNGYGTVQGMVLGPAFRATALTGGTFAGGIIFQGNVYLSAANFLYRVTLSAGAVSVVSLVGSVTGNITGMWVENNRLWLAQASPATTFASTDGVTITAAPGSVVVTQGFTFAQGNWIISRTSATTIGGTIDGGTTWNYYQTEAAIRSVCATGRTVLVAHAAGVDELTGSFPSTTFSGGLTPLVRTVGAGTSGDYTWMVDFEGNVYAWFDGTVCLLQRSTVSYGRLLPVAGAPRGNGQSAVTAAGRLWVSLTTTGGYEVWSFDGMRWVRNLAPGGGVNPYVLVSCAGIATDADLLALPAGGGSVYGFLTASLAHTAYPAASGAVTCGPWDAEKPDASKTWTEVEVVWNLPDRAVGNPWGAVLIETSVNGGTTWTTAGTTNIVSGTGGTIRTSLSGVSGETLTVRVTWTPSANGTAFRIVAVYANGWELPASPMVKRWQIKVRCTDKLVRRDGTVDSRSGEQMRAALIALASAGTAVTFQDLDYDANAVNQTVRVVEIEETSRKGDGTHFWESEMAVGLEAIA